MPHCPLCRLRRRLDSIQHGGEIRVNRSTPSVRAIACAALIALAMPAVLPAATPFPPAFDAAHQYPSSATTGAMPPALRNAVEQSLARDPDATWIEHEIVAADGQA